MSHFYGYLQGSRGQTTRCGGKSSGINTHIKSWDNDVYASLNDENGKDVLSLNIPIGLKVVLKGKEYIMTDGGLKALE